MPTLRLLAIEDEPLYAESLRLVIEELGYILIDVTDSISAFQRLVKATLPDMLLIDVDLGAEIDGIELANRISEECDAPIIFITASKDLATIIRSKTARPSAYIPKPYEASTLQAAIELAAMNKSVSSPTAYALSMTEESFFVKSEGVLKKIKVSDVQYIEVKEKYCHIQTRNGEIQVNMRLKDLIEKLPQQQIMQVHRSFAVMKEHIDEVDTGLTNIKVAQTTIPIGKNHKDSLSSFLKRLD